MDVLLCLWYVQTHFSGGPHSAYCSPNPLVGLPSALLCMWGSTLANAALFALIFPSVSAAQLPILAPSCRTPALVHNNGGARPPRAKRPIQSLPTGILP